MYCLVLNFFQHQSPESPFGLSRVSYVSKETPASEGLSMELCLCALTADTQLTAVGVKADNQVAS